MKKFVEFYVWNDKEERAATKEEVITNIEIVFLENGTCAVKSKNNDFSLLTE